MNSDCTDAGWSGLLTHQYSTSVWYISISFQSLIHRFLDVFASMHVLAHGSLFQTLQLMGVAGRGNRSPRPPWRCRSSRWHPSTTYALAPCHRTASSRDGSAHAPQTFQPKGDETRLTISPPEFTQEYFDTWLFSFSMIVRYELGWKVFDQRNANAAGHKWLMSVFIGALNHARY